MSALRSMSRLVSIGMLACAAAMPVGAQTLPGDSTPAPIQIELPIPASTGALATGAALATAASWVGGAIIGHRIGTAFEDCQWTCDWEGFEGAVIGSIVLPSIVVPATVHVIDRGAGSLAATLAATLGAGLVGTLVGASVGGLDGILVGPIAQLVTAVAVEHGTAIARRRAR